MPPRFFRSRYMTLLSLDLWQRMRIHFAPGHPLGRLCITPLARSTLKRRDIYCALALHKAGPWDGLGARWHDCCLDYPAWVRWERRTGQALYSGGYSAARQMILVRTAPDR